MIDAANPTAALRAAIQDVLTMLAEALGDEGGAKAMRTAIDRIVAEVTGSTSKRVGRPPKARVAAIRPAPAAPKASGATTRKPKRQGGTQAAGRLRQIAAMKAYWKKRKAERQHAAFRAEAGA